MNAQYTQTAQRALDLAQHEALRFNHEYIGTEHVLLGLLRIRCDLMAGLGLDLRTLRLLVEEMAFPGQLEMPHIPIPCTPRVKHAVKVAQEISMSLGSDLIDWHHLLLGMLHDSQCLAFQMLGRLGVDSSAVRQQITSLGESADN